MEAAAHLSFCAIPPRSQRSGPVSHGPMMQLASLGRTFYARDPLYNIAVIHDLQFGAVRGEWENFVAPRHQSLMQPKGVIEPRRMNKLFVAVTRRW